MIYVKDEATGVTVEDGLHGYVTILGDDDEHIAASPGQADAIMRGLLRWQKAQIDPEESNEKAALFVDLENIEARLERMR